MPSALLEEMSIRVWLQKLYNSLADWRKKQKRDEGALIYFYKRNGFIPVWNQPMIYLNIWKKLSLPLTLENYEFNFIL